ncbi:Heterotrimeric G-protein alpha subunit, GPA3-like protein [Mycena venus]|uniref:Heterotrimeric G-protein alpha subunit, GPA3-like protein n=1 Tax=Mycena venus TaxID=2733690 RepID=A0A8H6YJX8_9AGAR|nr:Heterotrimeric G-protein alpha subunit, GPA3-like protein [Mycena venus]
MASHIVSNALIQWDPHVDRTVQTQEGSGSRKRWALLRSALASPSPGRTLDQIYTSLGKVLETQANRAAHNLGLGPHVVAEKIKSVLGDGDERVEKLVLLRTSIAPKLENLCKRLMKYTLPTQSAKTQSQAFKNIVDIITLFPGLRTHLLRTECMDGATSMVNICAVWDRCVGSPTEEWTFWQTLAATSLSDNTIAPILEETAILQLMRCDEDGLSVIERLLIENDCSCSKFSKALCVRYLGGILDLPGFWSDTGTVHSNVAKKLCAEMVRLLRDIGVDILILGPIAESVPMDDYDGIDFLATTILNGLSSWFDRFDNEAWAVQPWYENFRQFLQLLRSPRSAVILPNAFAGATSFDDILPAVYHNAEVDILVACAEGGSNTRDAIPDDHLGQLDNRNDSTSSFSSNITEQVEHSQDPGSLGGDDIDSLERQSQNSTDRSSTSDHNHPDSVVDITEVDAYTGSGNLETGGDVLGLSRILQKLGVINRQISDDSKRPKKECKILVLGPGESGKSTIVKQMRLIHQAGFNERERAEYRSTIYRNVLDSAVALARVVRRVGLAALGEEEREWARAVLRAFPVEPGARGMGDGERESKEVGGTDEDGTRGSVEVGLDPVPFTLAEERTRSRSPYFYDGLAQTHAVLTPALADAIWHVARVPAVERLVDENPAEFCLIDSAGYFFSSIHRIAAPTYVPSEEDVLRARAQSTAIIETRFWMGDLMIHMFDVGGVRSERKKWIHCFESVTSIIFCTALSEYDQVLLEERKVNRMRESLYLFESVINSRWFLRTSVFLFLNKIDVFKRKLPKIPFARFFPEYEGGNDLQRAAKYILWKFMQGNRAKLTVYPHITQATDTKNIRLVFAAVKETVLQNALKDSGIL